MAAAKPLSQPPEKVGCYHDHDPHAAAMGAQFVGTRLLKYGMPGCSGAWGCGTGPNNIKDCPAWPATLEKCTRTQATPECELRSQTPPYAGQLQAISLTQVPRHGVAAALGALLCCDGRLCHDVHQLEPELGVLWRRWLRG